ncbi:MAG: enoyl-CoA hydratase/isomerase family protein, partial [Actinobacteria bacterium]|nr:enoyl-CoA hydratase/isomerase family protein [Actinomycetota bacterium]
ELYHAVNDALTDAAERDDLAVVVVTGAGRAFSAGQDLGEMARLGNRARREPGDASTSAEGHGFASFMSTLLTYPKPLIAAVNGLAVGLGLTMLAHCDLVLVADDARLRAPFVSLGVVPEAASSALLPAVMGWQAAAHAFFTASWIDAQRAVDTGIAWARFPNEKLVDEALELAHTIAAMPLVSLVRTKALIRAARGPLIEDARRREDAEFADLTGGPANREAIAAFLEKREPDFTRLPSE